MAVLPPLTRQAQNQKSSGFFGAISFRLKKILKNPPVMLLRKEGKQTGEGFVVGSKKYFNHTNLHPDETALFNFSFGQKLFFLIAGAVLGTALLFNWHAVIVILLTIFTLIYFFDVLFNVFLVYRSFSRQPEINIEREELDVVPGAIWPMYTVFCPLYKEWEVVPQFVSAVGNMDYPKDRLQVLLLLEEDDEKTIQKVGEMALPKNFEVVIVPHSFPKTKPKALNYGLKFARGQYVVIYDAEDVPDPKQLKKAVLAFTKADPKTICVQAKLNFYNPRQNLLTKIFTAEYSLWFDLVLPGLQSVGAPIPLGGTSNHFRTKDVIKLKGWDAFNVTEDCDLGIRLAKNGYQTAIFNSTTWEEANSDLKNWYNQRSRWIKGYMQTYLVHMRQWRKFLQNKKRRDLVFFQTMVGGKVVSMFVNPFMWAATIAYFAFRPTLGNFIQSFFPTPLLYLGVFSFVFGNFFYLYQYMVGCAKRGFDGLVRYVFLVPVYWVGMSLAAWKALYELVFKPHYWSKTIHGLHLQEGKASGSAKIRDSKQPFARPLGQPAFRKLPQPSWLDRAHAFFSTLSGGGVLVAATVISSFINFLFNLYLGRVLSLEQFSLVTLFNTLMVFLGIVTTALSTTVNHRTAYVSAKGDLQGGLAFRSVVKNYSLTAGIVLSFVWLLAVPLLMVFFKVSGLALGFLSTPALLFGLLSAVDRGYLLGLMRFKSVGVIVLSETVSKFAAAAILSSIGLSAWVALSLPFSLGVAFLLAWILAVRVKRQVKPLIISPRVATVQSFPRRFFAAAVLTGLSSMAFLSLDVILAKHYLDPAAAGQYALLSLVGKMIYYFGSLLSLFIITFTSRDEGANTNPNPGFYKLLSLTVLLVISAYVGLGTFGRFTVPLLFGSKALSILPYLSLYTAAVAMFTVASAFVIYHLARKHLLFSFYSLFVSGLAVAGIWFRHSSILSIVQVMFAASVLYLVTVGALHLLQRNGRFIVRNLVDLVDAFFPLARPDALAGGKRILIFNWRDTRHVFAGGAETYIHELAKRWVKGGNHVTVFCGNDGRSLRTEIVDGVRVIRRGGFYLVYLWAFVYYLLQFRGKFDLIIDSENGIPFFTPLYAKERVVCLLHHVHQDVFRKYLNPVLASIASMLENRVMPWAYRNVKFITTSNSSKNNMRDLGLGLDGVQIVNPGVDLSFLRPGRKDKQPLVLYLGRLKAYKSVDVLVKAFKNVILSIPQARLVIAGSGEEEKNLKELVQALDLGQQVEFTGKVSEQEKLTWMQRAWLLVNPSLVEGWGITTIEANACGAPVVAADVPGLRDSVKNPHTGLLVPHGDITGFSQKITKLLKDHELRAHMGRQALMWAQNFDWNKISKTSMKALQEEEQVDALQPAEIVEQNEYV